MSVVEVRAVLVRVTVTKSCSVQLRYVLLSDVGVGHWSTSVPVALAVVKGMEISKKVKIYGYKNSDLPKLNLENVEVLIKKKLLEKNLIKPIYLS